MATKRPRRFLLGYPGASQTTVYGRAFWFANKEAQRAEDYCQLMTATEAIAAAQRATPEGAIVLEVVPVEFKQQMARPRAQRMD